MGSMPSRTWPRASMSCARTPPMTSVLQGHGVRISMDGKRRFMDNIFVERLWRSLKYEEVYTKAYKQLESTVTLGKHMIESIH